jgi:phage terminase large subunit
MKSHFFAELMIRRARRQPGFRGVCIREVQNSLAESVKRLLEDKIKEFGLGSEFRILQSHIETLNDGIIIFRGMKEQTAESIKSLEGYDVAWVEEAQTFSERSLTLLRPTIRKDDSELWFSWNPNESTDPVDKFFREANPPDCIIIETSYLDNPRLPQVMLREAEWDRQRDADKYAHVWLGKYKKISELRVFRNWKVEAIEAPIDIPRLFGGDWGFSIDPTVLISGYMHPELKRTLVIDHEVYEVGCEIEDTPDLWDALFCDGLCPAKRSECERPSHGAARRWPIIGDSARPETISHMQRHGYKKLEPSKKGPNSVEEGVIFLQGLNIIVHPRCRHAINELQFYSYKADPLTGRPTAILADKKNHVIDSARYMLEPLRAEVKASGGLLW